MKLHIPYPSWQQMQVYVNTCSPLEVTGIGALETLSEDEVMVEEIFLPYQNVTVGHSEFLQGELARILIEYDEKHPDETSKLWFRWHSHGVGRPYWSTIDAEDIERWKGGQVINLVTNVRGEYLARLDRFYPQREESLPVEVVIGQPECDDVPVRKYVEEVYKKIPNVKRREEHLHHRSAQTAYRPSPIGDYFTTLRDCFRDMLGKGGEET